MEKKGTSVFSNGLIWFGAGVSIAEILTGTYFAPLGFGKAMAAILLGHLIGGLMMFAAGMIGAREKRSAMETVKMSFGNKGSLLFAILNVLQLVGWTAIMIYDGALAANGIFSTGEWVWAIVIGVLIIVWILVGLTNLGKLNTIAMAALFILTLVLFKVIFLGGNGAQAIVDDSLSFGAAVELAVAMPLSWLPLISDYTREAACSNIGQRYCVQHCQHFHVHDRNGRSHLHRRVRHRTDHAEGRIRNRWSADHRIFNGYNHIPRCVFRRCILRIDLGEDSGEVGSNHRDHHRNDRSDCVSDGQYHQLPVPDRFGFRADDRCTDRRLFHPEKGRLVQDLV